MCTPVLQTDFMCTCTVNIQTLQAGGQTDETSDRNEQGTDITNKMNVQGTHITSKMNVQGTDITQNLVLFTHVQLTCFLYSCTVNLFCVHVYSKIILQTHLL